MMAIVVAGLGSAPIRRLKSSWAQVPKSDMELFHDMDAVLDSRVSGGVGGSPPACLCRWGISLYVSKLVSHLGPSYGDFTMTFFQDFIPVSCTDPLLSYCVVL